MKSFAEFGIKIPDILLPRHKDLSSWSVIACDQYTQDSAYWDKVSACAQGKPSTLNLILPEVYLCASDKQERIQNIRKTMQSYLADGVFDEPLESFIYAERKTGYGRVRHGLVAAIDLEDYEWKPMSHALIRATEATIIDRIPPRKEIRRDAMLESPHIMLLVNDPEHLLVEKTGELVRKDAPVYDGDLMLDSGHITGWAVKSAEAVEAVAHALSALKKANTQADGSTFLFAVGDGNHSLATAKAVWDEYKEARLKAGESEESLAASNVRYALVEIVNIYDSGLTFEPIHRVLFGADAGSVISYVQQELGGAAVECADGAALEQKVKASKASFGFVYADGQGKKKYVCLETEVKELAVSRLQPVLDAFISKEKADGRKIEIDYIHGSDEVFRLGGSAAGTVSVLLPPVAKDSFFATISGRGPLPRKSFSMGEASEKRFYLECRRLFD